MLKINHPEDKIFFTSDLHLFHQKDFIYKPRGFASWEEHTAYLKDRLLSLKDDDILFYNGDFALNAEQTDVDSVLASIKCRRIYYIMGNHESKTKNVIRNFALDVSNYNEVVVNGKMIVLCHYPIASWNGMSHGSWMIHGHTHGTYELGRPENTTAKILDVGVDTKLNFWSMADVREVMSKKGFQEVDHHVKEIK